jgi:hypothetical protein
MGNIVGAFIPNRVAKMIRRYALLSTINDNYVLTKHNKLVHKTRELQRIYIGSYP